MKKITLRVAAAGAVAALTTDDQSVGRHRDRLNLNLKGLGVAIAKICRGCPTQKADQADGHIDVHEELAPSLIGADGQKAEEP